MTLSCSEQVAAMPTGGLGKAELGVGGENKKWRLVLKELH